MSLLGNVNDLPLSDLLQVNASNRRTCIIKIKGDHTEGEIYLHEGKPTHAHYNDLIGDAAIHAMLATQDLSFEVVDTTKLPGRNVTKGHQTLIMEAAQFLDEGKITAPTPKPAPAARRSQSAVQSPISKKKPSPTPIAIAAILLLVIVGIVLVQTMTSGPANSQLSVSESPAADINPAPANPYEAAELTGPNDSMPKLLSGKLPISPLSDHSMAPTIICRILIDSLGRVQEQRIYRSRLELAVYEELALDTVATYRFSPGVKDGADVPVWMNWPVSFADAKLGDRGLIRIKGSDTIGGALGPNLARDFEREQFGYEVSVKALGSSTAFAGLFDGSADIGASSRSITEAELEKAQMLGIKLREFVIGYDGIAVIVHPQNPIQSLTVEETSKVFSGAITNWSELGGNDASIRLICRPEYSGTHVFFKNKVLRQGNDHGPEEFAESTLFIERSEIITRMVSEDINAIAFVGLGWADEHVHTLAMSLGNKQPRVMPTQESIRNGSYPIYRPLMMYTLGTPKKGIKSFLYFVLSNKGQKIVEKHGFVPIDINTAAILKNETEDEQEAPIVKRIWFNGGNSKLNNQAHRDLDLIKEQIEQDKLRAILTGHADAEGTDERNEVLSEQRALAVASYLQKNGVDPAYIDIESNHESLPLASNETEDGRRVNRRVDIFLIRRQ